MPTSLRNWSRRHSSRPIGAGPPSRAGPRSGTWLVSILRHKIVNHLRRSGREEQTDPDGLGDERIFDRAGRWISTPAKWSGNPVEDMERGEFWACFHGCLSRLPSNVADAFLLRELEDCDADDVCKVLEITPANLHTRLYRARMLLRDCLGRRWFGASNSKEEGRMMTARTDAFPRAAGPFLPGCHGLVLPIARPIPDARGADHPGGPSAPLPGLPPIPPPGFPPGLRPPVAL